MRGFLAAILMLGLALAAVAQAPAAGGYKGSWTADSGQGGGISFTLSQSGGKWEGKAEFTMAGATVPCKVTRLEVSGSQLILAYDFALEGYDLRSTLTGTAEGKAIRGAYRTTAIESGQEISSGKFDVSLD